MAEKIHGLHWVVWGSSVIPSCRKTWQQQQKMDLLKCTPPKMGISIAMIVRKNHTFGQMILLNKKHFSLLTWLNVV